VLTSKGIKEGLELVPGKNRSWRRGRNMMIGMSLGGKRGEKVAHGDQGRKS
jgi:hypothetical protein